MLAIEVLGVLPVEPVHPGLKVVRGDIEEQVVMRRHEAERVACPVKAADRPGEPPAEVGTIEVVPEHWDRACAPRGDVVDPAWDVASRLSSHAVHSAC